MAGGHHQYYQTITAGMADSARTLERQWRERPDKRYSIAQHAQEELRLARVMATSLNQTRDVLQRIVDMENGRHA